MSQSSEASGDESPAAALGEARRADLGDISDDASASPAPSPRASPLPAFDGDEDIVVSEEELDADELAPAGARSRSRSRSRSPSPSRSRSPSPVPRARLGPSHKRSALALPRPSGELSVVQMPPAIDVPLGPSRPESDDLPQSALTRIMYRMRKGVTRGDALKALEEHGPRDALLKVAESNTRLVTWSDGSRTFMVGNEHFSVTDDRDVPPNLFVFRRGADVQCYHGAVGTYARVQPCMVNRRRNSALLMSGGDAGQPKARQMLRTMDGKTGDGEDEENRKAAQKSQRDYTRKRSRKRKIVEKGFKHNAQLTKRALEDDDDEDDDDDDDDVDEDGVDFGHRRPRARWQEEQERRREDEDMERKIRQKKAAAVTEEAMAAVRRRNQKVGTRRVISDDDEEDDEDSE